MNNRIMEHLQKEGIENLTPIQEQSMPEILEGRNVLGVSPTGTGKTYAYLIPVTERIDMQLRRPQVIVLTPTHELCAQVFKRADALLKCMDDSAEAALIIGGANIKRQLEKLKRKPKIIVGSAGRILEMIRLGKISGHYVKTIVIDEADRMLDEQNFESVKQIIGTTLRDRQLLFYTASAGGRVLNAVRELAGEGFVFLNCAEESPLPEKISHKYIACQVREKFDMLRKITHAEKIGRGVVFVGDSNDVDFLTKRLNYHGIKAVAVHGQVGGEERRLAVNDFMEGRAGLLVASDIAARGLDIPDVTHIISMDVPEEPSFYLHRAGRTGRMGKPGVSITIASGNETNKLKKIEKKLGIKIEEFEIRFGKIMEVKSEAKEPSK